MAIAGTAEMQSEHPLGIALKDRVVEVSILVCLELRNYLSFIARFPFYEFELETNSISQIFFSRTLPSIIFIVVLKSLI